MEEPKMQTSPAAKNTFLECERDIVFILMMLVAGYFGAFTYSIRGGCRILRGLYLFYTRRRILQRTDRKLCPPGHGSGKRPVVPRSVFCHSHYRLLCGDHALRGPARLCKEKPSDPVGYPAARHRDPCGDLSWLSSGKRPGPDHPGADQLHLLHAVQYLPPGGRYSNGHHLLYQPHPAGGYRYYKILTSSPGTAFPSAEAADPCRHAGFLCPGRRSFYFSLPLFPGKSHLVLSYTPWLCPGRPSLCRSGKRKRAAGSDSPGALIRGNLKILIPFSVILDSFPIFDPSSTPTSWHRLSSCCCFRCYFLYLS